MTDETLQTEFEFTLPKGYVDDGTLHKEGRMRLATAADEIQPLNDPRVQSNSSYLTIVLLARTVTELGSLETADEDTIQNLFVPGLEHLQAMYERVNNGGLNAVDTACPECVSSSQSRSRPVHTSPMRLPKRERRQRRTRQAAMQIASSTISRRSRTYHGIRFQRGRRRHGKFSRMIHLHDPDALFKEVAFAASHFGRSREAVLEMCHWERQR